MQARKIAWLGALAAAALAGAIAAALALREPAVTDMHRRYRVEFEPPPVEAALWFAARYPEYFRSGEAGLGPWLETLDPRDRDFVLAMAQTLTWAWVEHELERAPQPALDGLARAAIVALRHKTLNQLEVGADRYAEVADIEFDAYIGAPEFGAGVFARLVRGVSNCEGQNHLLAVLLEAGLDQGLAGFSPFEARIVGAVNHELVRVVGPPLSQPVYVDAWSNLTPFTLDPARPGAAPSLAAIGEAPPPLVPEAASRPPFAAAQYVTDTDTHIELIPERDAPRVPVDLKIRAPALDRASLSRIEDPWRIYIFARILHIYDDPRAREVYQFLLDRDCQPKVNVRPYIRVKRPPPTMVCAAATLLIERVEPQL